MIKLTEQLRDKSPVNCLIKLLEPGKKSIFIEMNFDSKIGKGKVLLRFSLSHEAACECLSAKYSKSCLFYLQVTYYQSSILRKMTIQA